MRELILEALTLLAVGVIGSTASLITDTREEFCEDYLGGTFVRAETPYGAVPDQCPDGRWRNVVGLGPRPLDR